jgi:hypothetical protein
MNEKQLKMLQEAQLDWLDRELLKHGVPKLIVERLRQEEMGSMGLFAAIAWLEENEYKIAQDGNQSILLQHGEVLSRFVWTVED